MPPSPHRRPASAATDRRRLRGGVHRATGPRHGSGPPRPTKPHAPPARGSSSAAGQLAWACSTSGATWTGSRRGLRARQHANRRRQRRRRGGAEMMAARPCRRGTSGLRRILRRAAERLLALPGMSECVRIVGRRSSALRFRGGVAGAPAGHARLLECAGRVVPLQIDYAGDESAGQGGDDQRSSESAHGNFLAKRGRIVGRRGTGRKSNVIGHPVSP